MFARHQPPHDFRKRAHLLVGVAPLDRQVEVHPGGAGGFYKSAQANLVQFAVQGPRDGDHRRKLGSFGRVQVEEDVVGKIEAVPPAGPGIVVDAAQIGQIQQGRPVVGDVILDFLPALLGINPDRIHPLRHRFARILLKERLPADAVRVAAQDKRPVLEERQQPVGHPVVVGQQLPLGDSLAGKVNLVEVRQPQRLSIELDGDVLPAAAEQLLFNLSQPGEHTPYARGCLYHRWRRGWRLRSKHTLRRVLLGLDADEDGRAQTLLLGPAAVLDPHHPEGLDPMRLLLSLGLRLKRAAVGG